jgi:hypothetical protein
MLLKEAIIEIRVRKVVNTMKGIDNPSNPT